VTNQQRGIIAAVFVVALLGGGLLAFLLANRGGGEGVSSATTSPEALVTTSPDAGASPSASLTPSVAPSTEPPSATPSAAPTATPTAAPTPTPTPTSTPPPPRPATVVVTQLKLDAKTDPVGHTRRISFTTAGKGPVSIAMRVTSNGGAVATCMAHTGAVIDCRTTSATTYTSTATRANHDYAISLIGAGDATPIVEVTMTFPASTPQILIERPRFGGTDTPEYNGIQVIVQPRRGGDVTIDATWGDPFKYEIDLFEQGGDGRSQQFPDQPAASGVQRSFPITGTNPWKLVLQNIEPGTGRTQITATIGWP